MKEQMFFEQFQMFRGMLYKAVEGLTEEHAGIIPAGFNNNIHWNLGHILLSTEQLVLVMGLGQEPKLPESYNALFGFNSKPADWTGDVPTLETLISQLNEQVGRLQEGLSGRLEEDMAKSFPMGPMTVSNIGQVFNFAMIHEVVHASTIQAMKRIVQVSVQA